MSLLHWQADSLPLPHLGRPWEKEDAAYYFTHTHTHPRSIRGRDTHTHPRNIPELPRNLEHHKHFYVVSICLSESLCSDTCHDERIGGFKSLCQGMGVIPTAPVFPGHVPGHKCIDTPGRGSAKWALSCGLRTSPTTGSLLAALVFGHCHAACGILVPQRGTAEKAMAPHSSTLAWKIPWMEEPGRLQSMG